MRSITYLTLTFLLSCQARDGASPSGTQLSTDSTMITNSADPLSGYPDALSFNNQVSMPDPALDYLIMDVCVDVNNLPVKGDPASCDKHRNIRIGERVPYLLTDFDTTNNKRYQSLTSLPVAGTDGTLKILVTKHFQPGLTPDFKFNYNYDKNITGYDLLDPNGAYVSGIRTSDGGCFDQIISTDSYQRQNGWIFFQRNTLSGSLNHNIFMDRIDPDRPKNCKLGLDIFGNTRDIWNAPAPWTYESNKVLTSIITYHYANKDLSKTNNALERFFFTREYGFSRWESWIPVARCLSDHAKDPSTCDPDLQNNYLRGRCLPITGKAIWGNQNWVRTDCRDSTSYQELKISQLPIDFKMAATNDIKDLNHDYNFILGPEIFNVHFYMKKYSDVGTSISAATNHWLTLGIFEGRQGSENFNVKSYLTRNSDLFFGSDYKKAIIHYSQLGIQEGRSGKP